LSGMCVAATELTLLSANSSKLQFPLNQDTIPFKEDFVCTQNLLVPRVYITLTSDSDDEVELVDEEAPLLCRWSFWSAIRDLNSSRRCWRCVNGFPETAA